MLPISFTLVPAKGQYMAPLQLPSRTPSDSLDPRVTLGNGHRRARRGMVHRCGLVPRRTIGIDPDFRQAGVGTTRAEQVQPQPTDLPRLESHLARRAADGDILHVHRLALLGTRRIAKEDLAALGLASRSGPIAKYDAPDGDRFFPPQYDPWASVVGGPCGTTIAVNRIGLGKAVLLAGNRDFGG